MNFGSDLSEGTESVDGKPLKTLDSTYKCRILVCAG